MDLDHAPSGNVGQPLQVGSCLVVLSRPLHTFTSRRISRNLVIYFLLLRFNGIPMSRLIRESIVNYPTDVNDVLHGRSCGGGLCFAYAM